MTSRNAVQRDVSVSELASRVGKTNEFIRVRFGDDGQKDLSGHIRFMYE